MEQLNQSDPQYIKAMSEFMQGNWSSAESSFKSLLKDYPESGFILLNLGNIYYSQGSLNKSIEYYLKALEKEPDWGVAYYKLGVTYFRAGKLIKALESFNKVIELKNQSHAMASYFVGLINFFLGRDDDSDQAFSAFHEIAPESMIANFFLAQIKIKENHFNEAIKLLNELLEETPLLSEGHYMLGQAYYGLHRNTDAIKAFRKVLEINPDDQRAKTKLTLMTDLEW
ncbi:tetratricopeptide repeat protein [Salinispira pacifica]|uniref:Uncharacterized protein n=1 Tax=Salinispira pacifica TaxID=1307761 RepID=V5WKZ4_9SPIO|nr:tetratricopeptide repeat protein [Salinispira pacifica]AHC16214.1 hypothetical protein L21SP2_2866 [Salinispira pacifica]